MAPHVRMPLPIPVLAVLTWFDDECQLLVHCQGDIPCSGSFIVGLEVKGDGGGIRHCCIEYSDASPAGIFTFDLTENLQFAHDVATVNSNGSVLEGRFPAWAVGTPGAEWSFSAFCIQNGVTTARGIEVEQSRGRAGPEAVSDLHPPATQSSRRATTDILSDRFHFEPS
ncbi:hypothetical protein SRABI83_01344 [Arthrobacter sp. Bi83]|jgi:hypothetical protein|nr:hypothetical protein SRABI83_01344 [Arthrobacter sp. Bi83]